MKKKEKNNTIQCKTIQCNTIQYNTIQYDTMQYNAIQYNTRQYKTRQEKTRQDKARQDKTRQDKTRQDKTRQCNAKQCNAMQYNTRQDWNKIKTCFCFFFSHQRNQRPAQKGEIKKNRCQYSRVPFTVVRRFKSMEWEKMLRFVNSELPL